MDVSLEKIIENVEFLSKLENHYSSDETKLFPILLPLLKELQTRRAFDAKEKRD